MKVFNEKEDKELELDFKGTVNDLLEHLDINPETVIVAVNDEIVDLDEVLGNDDIVKILSVVSGG